MLSKIISVGDRVEVLKWKNSMNQNSEPEILASQVLEIPEQNILKISMPMEKTKTVYFHIGEVRELYIYTQNGTYAGNARVTGRYMEGLLSVLVVEMISGLERIQRRRYFRVECVADLFAYVLDEEETELLEKSDDKAAVLEKINKKNKEWYQGVATDISGGGLRFTTMEKLKRGQILLISLELEQKEIKKYFLFAYLLSVSEVEKRPGYYENRVQFLYMKNSEREEIIRFVFDEERKRLKRERG